MHEDNNKQKKKERKLGHGGAKWLLKCYPLLARFTPCQQEITSGSVQVWQESGRGKYFE